MSIYTTNVGKMVHSALKRSLMLPAIVVVTALSAGAALADSSVVVDLSGVKIKSGSPPTVYSQTSIDLSTVYDYTISGTVSGSGALSSIQNEDIATVLHDDLGIKDTSFLSGRVYNPAGKFPYTVVRKTKNGKFKFSVFTVTGSVVIRAGITKDGLCGFTTKLLGFSFFGVPTPTLTFDSGSTITVTVDTTADPDLFMTSASGKVIGKGTSGGSLSLKIAPNKSVSIPVTIQNDSSVSDAINLAVASLPTGFSQTVSVKGSSTPIIDSMGTNTTLPSLATLKTTKLVWTITNTGATSGATATATLTAKSGNNASKTDTLSLDLTGK
ncbi:MAG: hypothetical protein QM796_19375 [Chthoniobacteraceae bacterium]